MSYSPNKFEGNMLYETSVPNGPVKSIKLKPDFVSFLRPAQTEQTGQKYTERGTTVFIKKRNESRLYNPKKKQAALNTKKSPNCEHGVSVSGSESSSGAVGGEVSQKQLVTMAAPKGVPATQAPLLLT